jgi:alpha-L-rhamnosidase
MVGEIEWTRGWYESPNGRIESSWSLEGEMGTLDVTIPVNATATVVIPSAEVDQITESGEPVSDHPEIMNITPQDSTTHVEIGSGDWSFEFPKR